MQARNIPGFAEVVDWPVAPLLPLRVVNAEQWRSEGAPAWVVVNDSAGLQFIFGFDSLLGRLFFGAAEENSEDAAWVRPGSPLEAAIFPVLNRDSSNPQWPWLAAYVDRAAHWSHWSGDARPVPKL
jgi:hypothetical protein